MTTPIQLDIEAAIDRMGSQELYIEIGRSFAEAIPGTEQKIAEAVSNKAWQEARRFTHSLKSNCAAMGADELREKAYALEKACAAEDEPVVHELLPVVCEDLRALRSFLLSL